jgi:hypothetical protein
MMIEVSPNPTMSRTCSPKSASSNPASRIFTFSASKLFTPFTMAPKNSSTAPTLNSDASAPCNPGTFANTRSSARGSCTPVASTSRSAASRALCCWLVSSVKTTLPRCPVFCRPLPIWSIDELMFFTPVTTPLSSSVTAIETDSPP